MKSRVAVLLLAALPLSVLAQPAPPDLRDLPPVLAASAPALAEAEAPKRRCVAGCDGQSARVTWNEDGLNRFEEHRDEQGKLLRYFVHPKNGMPKYEVLLGTHRETQPGSVSARSRVVPSTGAQTQSNQAVWELKKF
ncbi:MAG: hypothetical protein J0L58_13130 [Burkholderiales bacterium]|uniref:hypothetical protein n=1 Tax=Inhella sp. TaxID=1921806 RepID=UPI001ACF18FA|nr:hypothetical protein [Burkholderiales bacterium]